MAEFSFVAPILPGKTDAWRKAVDEIKGRTLDNRNDEDPNLRDDINARMMQLYTFLKTIEGNHS